MSVVAYVLLNVRKGGNNNVAELLRNMQGIIDVTELYGEYDIIAKVEKENMEELQRFLINNIRSIKEIEQTATMIATSEKYGINR